MENNQKVVGIFGHYGNRNLGDESIITATIQHLRKRIDGVEIVCFSLRPNDTAFRYNLEAYRIRFSELFPGAVLPGDNDPSKDLPWNMPKEAVQPDMGTGDVSLKERLKALPVLGIAVKVAARSVSLLRDWSNEFKYLRRSYYYLKRFDLLIITGSNQFLDNFGGPWEFPYTLLKWSILAKLTGTKLAYVSVGAGPIDRHLSKFMVRTALRFAQYISYRDEASKAIIETRFFDFDSHVYPDLAHGLDYQSVPRPSSRIGKPVVAINPMPIYDPRYWCESDSQRYLEYVNKIARLVERLLDHDYPIFLFATMWRDDGVIVDIRNAVHPEYRQKIDDAPFVRESQQVDELMGVLQQADIIIASRFHATVLAFHVERAVLGICYHRKMADVMNKMGQNEYHEPFDTFSIDTLWQKMHELESHLPEEIDKIRKENVEFRRLIEEQWDQVVALVETSA